MVSPGTKLLRPPVEVTQFWRLISAGFGAVLVFVKSKKIISMKPNGNLNNFQHLLFHTIPPLNQSNLFLVLQKTGAKTAPWVPKLGYFDGRAPQLSAGLTTERRRYRPYVHCALYISQFTDILLFYSISVLKVCHIYFVKFKQFLLFFTLFFKC